MLDSTRVQIKARKEASGALLNLHQSYLFLKCDLVKMKLENWGKKKKRGGLGPVRGQAARSAPRQLKDGSRKTFSDSEGRS